MAGLLSPRGTAVLGEAVFWQGSSRGRNKGQQVEENACVHMAEPGYLLPLLSLMVCQRPNSCASFSSAKKPSAK